MYRCGDGGCAQKNTERTSDDPTVTVHVDGGGGGGGDGDGGGGDGDGGGGDQEPRRGAKRWKKN